ncbi:hypothetical protein MANES_11G060085v8 [Manihot esculenta]|uniref:Uncharacterized protein n=2 Tax=Manihot esculenta TaxID=3983 RepID=A0ACB7GU95_MANES|nr:hypothetical protein MANES_11G060191v8 [Manihot esculenta]KAG8643722.1 hypothetical protein MANES_11G060085v8 [Manihot esculenta]
MILRILSHYFTTLPEKLRKKKICHHSTLVISQISSTILMASTKH